MTITEIIDEVAGAIVTARDFCGNEREAVRDWQADNGIFLSPETIASAFVKANAYWRNSQQEAGVKNPLSAGARAAAFRSLA